MVVRHCSELATQVVDILFSVSEVVSLRPIVALHVFHSLTPTSLVNYFEHKIRRACT